MVNVCVLCNSFIYAYKRVNLYRDVNVVFNSSHIVLTRVMSIIMSRNNYNLNESLYQTLCIICLIQCTFMLYICTF